MTHTSRSARGGAWILAVLMTALLASGCQVSIGGSDEKGTPSASPSSADASGAVSVDSQFTRDGTFQSHIDVPGRPGMDFVYTLYPTKSTPRTHEWYPRGNKYFSFTFQAYDLDRDLRDPFRTKRKVYLDTISVRSDTVTSDGSPTEHPYRLNAQARRITLDPEPVYTKYGMLVTSPKGAFELRNQAIHGTALDTVGLELTFTATVWVERAPHSGRFSRYRIKQVVPIAIFPSEEKTQAQRIPVDAN